MIETEKYIDGTYARYYKEHDFFCSNNGQRIGKGLDAFKKYEEVRKQIDEEERQQEITASLMAGLNKQREN